jgi:pyruvate kinase
MKCKILCTLGPNSLNEKTIKNMTSMGVTIFRINLSHTKIEDLEEVINFVRSHTEVPICLDSEGAQIRTGDIDEGSFVLKENTLLNIIGKQIKGSENEISLNHDFVVEKLHLGDMLSIDFNSVLGQVTNLQPGKAILRILNGGSIGMNKAITIDRDIKLPPLTTKDIAAIKLGIKMGIKYFALSFAHSESDVDEMRDLVGDSNIISKIECNMGLENLVDITKKSDAILIDRGDLSREQPIERIPILQKYITRTVIALGKEVYVATNLLESMVASPTPTRAEVNDIYNTLTDGVNGLVLAAETAIGNFPLQATKMVASLIKQHEKEILPYNQHFFKKTPMSSLVSPHGGDLVNQKIQEDKIDGIDSLNRYQAPLEVLMDAEQIGIGTYSPIQGFMGKADIKAVLEEYKLDNGITWSLPIVLQVTDKEKKLFSPNNRTLLTDKKNIIHSLIDVQDVFKFDKKETVIKWYSTDSMDHPGVAKTNSGGDWFVAGKVSLVNMLKITNSEYQLTPSQSREVFKTKGWSTIVGFHTRNVIHRAHEFIQKKAIDLSYADGLYVTPVIGPKKIGDYHSDVIMNSYKTMQSKVSYTNQLLLGAFSTYSRYSGPREAVFTALCRKNMGCSHFIIGRDHTGIGDFYKNESNYAIFNKLGDLGIKPIFFNTVSYNLDTNCYEEITSKGNYEVISGTVAREGFKSGKEFPDWFMDEEIQIMIKKMLLNDYDVFH